MQSFFSPGNFEPSALEYSEAHKMPATVGEYLTLGGAPASAPDFKGPVLVITGSKWSKPLIKHRPEIRADWPPFRRR